MIDSGTTLKSRVSRLLLDSDPMRIYFADIDNQDEYDSEAEELARLLPSCSSREACLDAARGVFSKYFGDLVISRQTPLDRVADGLWLLRQDLQEHGAER